MQNVAKRGFFRHFNEKIKKNWHFILLSVVPGALSVFKLNKS